MAFLYIASSFLVIMRILRLIRSLVFAGRDDFCFVEDSEIVSYEDIVDEVYLYKWNRKYPSDVKFPKDMLNEFKLEGSTDFEGNSHEKITEERYVRKK